MPKIKIRRRREVAKTIDELRNLVTMRGLEFGEVANELNLARDFFTQRKRMGVIDHGQLLDVLAYLDEDPVDFFGRIHRDTVARNPIAQEGPQGGQTVRPPKASTRKRLDTLDEKRRKDPKAALREAWAGIGELGADDPVRYLGVVGSCYRSLYDYESAEECLSSALDRSGNPLDKGDILQRLSVLRLHQRRKERALELAERAAGIYARQARPDLLGRALVDTASPLWDLGREEELRVVLAEADRLVALDDTWFRWVLHQHVADMHRRDGEWVLAFERLEVMRSTAPTPSYQGAAFVTASMVARDAGHYEKAIFLVNAAMPLLPPLELFLARLLHADYCAAARPSEAVAAVRAAATVCPEGQGKVMASLLLEARREKVTRAATAATLATAQATLGSRVEMTGGLRIRQLRELIGVSCRELSDMAGVPWETLRKAEDLSRGGSWESGARAAIDRLRPEIALITGGRLADLPPAGKGTTT